jgi:hypothetical protein
MSSPITQAMVDEALQSVDEEYSEANALANLLDQHGDWDWCEDSEHDPYDRLAIVQSRGSYWVVYRGSEPDEAERFEKKSQAKHRFENWAFNLTADKL